MGLDLHGTRVLLYARSLGVSLDHVAMLGRQTLHLSVAELRELLQLFDLSTDAEEVDALLSRAQGYAEPLFQRLGAETVSSFDASGYEQCTDVVDFNLPIAERYHRQYTLMLDSGSLEHIFNFPVAIRNCMEIVAPYGHVLSIVPANNFLGHGFYQFSPELFFRVFSSANGFAVLKMLVYEDRPGTDWYEVADPERAGRRAELANRYPTYLAVLAQRVKVVPLFTDKVMQSDYVRLWQRADTAVQGYMRALGRRYMKYIPARARMLYAAFERRGLLSRYDPALFKRVQLP
ncbi:MAG: hypothetical protein ACREWG_01795 [Gammaproteobacteria bacterium]